MKIPNYNLITNNKLQNFKGKEHTVPISYAEKKSNETKKEITTALIATAITSAFIGGALVKGKLANIDNKAISQLKTELFKRTQENKNIKKSNKRLQSILSETLIPEEIQTKYKASLLDDLKTINNDYDMTKPPVIRQTVEYPFAKTPEDTFTEEEARYKIVIPTEAEEKKIGIIRLAMQEFSDAICKTKEFTHAEAKPPIYLFDKTEKENRCYENYIAEAILDMEQQKTVGFWIEKGYLKKTSFADAFETALHEICHKFGGDETKNFSYKLTDIHSRILEKITENPEAGLSLKILNEIWKEIK